MIVFVGVIGGLMAFGVIGIFIGPAVLGVSYTLLSVWVNDPGVEETDPAQVSDSSAGNRNIPVQGLSAKRPDDGSHQS